MEAESQNQVIIHKISGACIRDAFKVVEFLVEQGQDYFEMRGSVVYVYDSPDNYNGFEHLFKKPDYDVSKLTAPKNWWVQRDELEALCEEGPPDTHEDIHLIIERAIAVMGKYLRQDEPTN